MILLKTLKWSNCFSYGANNSLDLSAEKITQILGTNGVGKSSIPLILEEVLFNKNSKGIKKAEIANRTLNKGYEINLQLDKDGDQYEIDLNRRASLKVKLLKNGEDISSHTATNTYKTIEQIIGIDFKTFSQIVYQNTNASLNFLTATDTNRKKFLIDLLGLEEYVAVFEAVKVMAREVENEYSELQGRLTTIEKWLESNKLTDTTPKGIQNLPEISEEARQELGSLTVDFQNLSSTNRKISQNNEYKKLLKNIPIDELRAIEVNERVATTEFEVEASNARNTKSSSSSFITKMNKLGDKCPTCEQSVDQEFINSLIAKESEKIAAADQIIEDTAAKIKEAGDLNRQYKRKSEGIREWQQLFSSIDQELPSEVTDANDLQERINALKTKIQEEEAEVRKIEKQNQAASAHNARIEVITTQTAEFEEQLKEVQESFDDIKEKRSNLEILKKAFSTNGLIAYKIENLVKELEEVTGGYLAELSDGKFTLNFAVTNDKLNVEITDNGNVVDIQALSSGELARVNTATLLGIRKMMSSLSSSRVNVLFLDEVMNVLDELGRERLVEVLLQEDLNTYIVSHQWSHPLLEKLRIEKIDEISRIVNG